MKKSLPSALNTIYGLAAPKALSPCLTIQTAHPSAQPKNMTTSRILTLKTPAIITSIPRELRNIAKTKIICQTAIAKIYAKMSTLRKSHGLHSPALRSGKNMVKNGKTEHNLMGQSDLPVNFLLSCLRYDVIIFS